jgi:hypothetical protein
VNVRRTIASGIVISVLLACLPIARPAPQSVKIYELDEILHLRYRFEDLFGKPAANLIERYGPPKRTESEDLYFASTPEGWLGFHAALDNGKLFGVKLISSPLQTLDVRKVIQKAPMFCFSSGTFSSSATEYFNARTKDGKTHLQFTIDGTSISLSAVIYTQSGTPCNPSEVGQ